MTLTQKVAAFLVAERKARGLSRAQLAEKLSISQSTLWRIEQGKGGRLTVGLLSEIGGLWGLQPAEIIRLAESRQEAWGPPDPTGGSHSQPRTRDCDTGSDRPSLG